ncbi:transcriptional regulator [Photobacterium sp. GB-50]|uniref:Rho-binding antiterminator n=1 Tax=unclassified Photobacterium TaxID=2628852 RepID=UPI000D164486|nr:MULTISPECIES: Rho-binding antiterminator [unclassified Photobacterium]PSV53475.1 transcriptional regulator [Photobacterium sp. GB-3]PSW71944.1 transcriptional regulator [Photobacterium sp. GB-50]
MISCHQHDYIEIACMLHLNVSLTYKNGEKISGIAQDTCYNAQREECIKLKMNNTVSTIVLDHLASMQALTANPHFETVNF